jgi:hypothetical protein
MATIEREAEPTPEFVTRLVDTLRDASDVTRPARRVARWMFPAAAALVTAVVAGVLALSYGLLRNATPSSGPTSTASALTPWQRALALHTAHLEAEGSNPKRPGPIIPVRGWPTYVTSVSATVMSRAQALRFLDNSTSSTPGGARVLVVQLRGRFASATSAPPPPSGHGPRLSEVRGNVITAVVSLGDGRVTDGGIGRKHRALPNPTTLYKR